MSCLPLSIVVTLALVATGVPQNFSHYVDATTLEGAKQVIAQGPAASQIAIKQLGTNGGGFFNVNSAHPFENPNAISNLIEMWAILVISAALTYTFGRMVRDTRQGWAIFAVMSVLFFAGLTTTYWAESQGNPAFAAAHVDMTPSALQAGGNMEGKEVRFGIVNSAIWAVATTDASNGSVNSMHDSYTPLGGLVEMLNIQLGEIIFGGVGAGLYGMLLFAIIAMFVAGLMVGRTPEYLGKKLEAKEVKMAMLSILILPFAILGLTALACVLPVGLSSLNNAGPHGFSEILYAFSLRRRQQRQRLRRAERQHPVLQFDHRLGDAARPLRLHRADDGRRRLARGQEAGAALGRDVPHPYAALCRPAVWRDPHCRWAHLLPGTGARADRRAFRDARRQSVLRDKTMSTISPTPMGVETIRKKTSVATLTDPAIFFPALGGAFRKLNPRSMIRNPVMFVVEIVAALTTILFIRDLVTGAGGLGLLVSDQSVALVHGAVRQFRGSRRRRPWQSASRVAAASQDRDRGQASQERFRRVDARSRRLPEGGRHRAGRGRRLHPERRRGDRGRRLG